MTVNPHRPPMTLPTDTSAFASANATTLKHRITDSLTETFIDAYQRGFREGWHIEDFPAWLDEEIEVCHTHLHGEDDDEEYAKLLGMLRAYQNAAHYLELHGISVLGESR